MELIALDVAEAKRLIFLDEPDKGIILERRNAGGVPHGRNAILQKLSSITQIHLNIPWKSTKLHQLQMTGQHFVVDYKGTYQAHPTFEAVMEKWREWIYRIC